MTRITDASDGFGYGTPMKVTYDPPPARPHLFARLVEDLLETALALLVTLFARLR